MRKDKIRIIVFALCIIALVSYGTAFAQSIPARNHMKVGRGHLEAGRLEQAEQELLEALKLDPTYSDAQYLLGLTYMTMKKLDSAQKCFEKVIQQEPKFETARLYLATVHLEKKNLRPAREELEFLIRNNPNNTQAYYGLGVVSYMEKDLAQAAKMWEKSINLDSNYAPAYYNLALVQYLLDKPDAARKLLDRAIKLRPQNLLYRFSASWISYLEGKKEGTPAEFEKLKNSGGNSPISFVCEGILDLEREDIDLAFECAGKAKQLDPGFQPSYVLAALCQEKTEDLEGALASYEEVLKLDPNETKIAAKIEKIKAILLLEEEEKKKRSNYPYHEENRTIW